MLFALFSDAVLTVKDSDATASDVIILTCKLVISNVLKDKPVVSASVGVTINDNTGNVWYQNLVTYNQNTTIVINAAIPSTRTVQYFATLVNGNTHTRVNSTILQVSCE